MACARCGCGVYQTEDIITLNKIWHKCCFTCYKCKKRLDKCNAKIFQGEVFCECCYNCLLDKLDLLSSPSKPCRVVSSPSCTCDKENCRPIKVLPTFENSKKCQVCFIGRQKANAVRASASCSWIPDKKACVDSKGFYYFAVPIPREVANYYNRARTMPKHSGNPCGNENHCCRPKKPSAFIKIRSICQPSCPVCGQPACRSTPPCRSPPHCCQPPPISCPPPVCCCPTQPRPCYPQPQPPACCPPFCPPPCPPPCSLPCPLPCSLPCPPSPQVSCFCPACCPPQPSCCNGCSCPPRPPCPQRPSCPKRTRSPMRRKPCIPCCPEVSMQPPPYHCCPPSEEKLPSCACKMSKYCPCGNLNPCSCKMCQVRALCTPVCNRCGRKVYVAEKISVSKGAYHTSCFSCFCCHKLLDLKNFYENCGEIYCKQCYNNLYGNQFHGYGSSQFC